MNPLQPQDAFGTTHVSGLLLLGINALARDVEQMTDHVQARAFTEPDDLDFVLVGLCALGAHIRSFGELDRTMRPTAGTAWPTTTQRLLR